MKKHRPKSPQQANRFAITFSDFEVVGIVF
jgi:hypothetical protein